jgi:hypothetical protein
MDLDGTPIVEPGEGHNGIRSMTCSGSEIAYVTEEQPLDVNIIQLGVRGQVGYAINASAPEEEDAILNSWGTPVDMENATIQNMTFDREYLAVTVNVSATDRLVLYNRTTAEQWLASNPKYHVSDLSLDHGVLAWSVRDHFNPLAPQAKYSDREIYFTDLATNTSHVLTSDSNDQWGPQVLEHHLVYFQSDGEAVSVEIYSWEPELRLYSSIVLQIGVLAAFFVVAWAVSRDNEHEFGCPQGEHGLQKPTAQHLPVTLEPDRVPFRQRGTLQSPSQWPLPIVGERRRESRPARASQFQIAQRRTRWKRVQNR